MIKQNAPSELSYEMAGNILDGFAQLETNHDVLCTVIMIISGVAKILSDDGQGDGLAIIDEIHSNAIKLHNGAFMEGA